jgi:hypothetical protein
LNIKKGYKGIDFVKIVNKKNSRLILEPGFAACIEIFRYTYPVISIDERNSVFQGSRYNQISRGATKNDLCRTVKDFLDKSNGN